MAYLASLFLPFLTAILVAAGTSVLWRQLIGRPFVYCAIAFLLALGLFSLLQSVVELVKNMWPLGGGYFIVSKMTPAEIEALERHRLIEGLFIAVGVVLLSYPLLVILKNNLAK